MPMNQADFSATPNDTPRESSSSIAVDARESWRDLDTFASQCALWKARGVDVVFSLDPQNTASHDVLKNALAICAAQQLKMWLRIEYEKSNQSVNNEGVNSEYSSRQSYLAYQTFDVARGAMALFERVREVVSAVAVAKIESDFPMTAPRLEWNNQLDITTDFAARADRGFSRITDEWGQARLYLWGRETENRFDALDANATRTLITSTRSALETILNVAPVRDAVLGIVLDVPPMWNEESPDAMRRFPYHHDLPRVFKALHGTDLPRVLPSLIADTGRDAVQVREDFWSSVSQMLRDNFARSWRDFSVENNFQLRFDFVDDNLNHNIARFGDITQLAQMADCCALQIDNITPSTRCGLRLLSSLSETRRQTRRQTHRETFPVFARSAASLSLTQRHELLHAGANAFETARDLSRDARNEELLADYTMRNCAFLRSGKSGARVAVLWPQRSLHAHHHPKAHRFVRWVEEDLAAATQLLDRLHYDYNFATEDEIVDATIENRVLVVGAKTPVECVILSSITCLARATWQKLEAFAQNGGKIVCLGLLPRWSEHGRDEDFETEIEAQTRTNIGDVYNFYKLEEHESLNELHQSDPSSVGYPVVRQTASGGRISTYQPRLNPDSDDARLRVRGLLTESVAPHLETQNNATRHRVRSVRVRSVDEETRFWTWHDDALAARAHLLMRPASQNQVSLSQCVLWDDSRNTTSTRCATLTREPVAVWMAMPANESGGVAFTHQYAGDEVRAFGLNPESAPHLESATFAVETFDGESVRGHATQSGAPSVAWRESGKLRRYFGERVVVESPILLNDEWQIETFASHIEYSMSVTLPPAWRDDAETLCVWLQVVPAVECVAVEAQIDATIPTRRLTAPWSFELKRDDPKSGTRETHITLRFWPRETDADATLEFPVARLVAYPRVVIAVSVD